VNERKVVTDTSSSSASHVAVITKSMSAGSMPSASSSALFKIEGTPLAQQMVALESAVLSHIKALRAIGKTTANTAEIAAALGVAEHLISLAVDGLKAKRAL
jgi:hypothetical protein